MTLAVEAMSAILNEDPPSLSSAGIQPQLNELVRRCLEKNPAERFSSARDFGFALQSISIQLPEQESKTNIPSIAVLPFSDMSPNKDQDYFCEGMAEEIINALTKIEGLKVAARTSSFHFKGKAEDIRQIGSALDVKTLLEGSVRTAGDRLRVTAQLVNVEDGYHLWSERYDRKMEDVFDIQDEISESIVDALQSKLIGDAQVRKEIRPTQDIDAYHLCLKGRYLRFTRYDFPKALGFFEQATRKDASYAEAFVGLADCYNVLGFYGYIRPEVARQKSNESVSRALGLNQQLGEAHAIRGFTQGFFDWDWHGAEQSFQKCMISLSHCHR